MDHLQQNFFLDWLSYTDYHLYRFQEERVT